MGTDLLWLLHHNHSFADPAYLLL
uniref:Uncharacterized protein n=1 Tax=Arundo donax TaxID=35708 RepID=A0A0A9BF62_ARUDO